MNNNRDTVNTRNNRNNAKEKSDEDQSFDVPIVRCHDILVLWPGIHNMLLMSSVQLTPIMRLNLNHMDRDQQHKLNANVLH